MPLNEREKEGFERILSYVPPEDIMALAKTIMRDQIVLTKIQEAVSAILLYTSNAEELFRRKKIKREFLFKYLYDEGITDTSPKADKTACASRILRFWGSTELVERMEEDDNLDLTVASPTLQFSSHPQQNILQDDALNCWLDRALVPSELDQQFAREFCQWFYVLLRSEANTNFNALGASCQPAEKFSSSHFFPDCTMHFLIKSPNSVERQQIPSAGEVVEKLRQLVCVENIIFNPNLEEKGLKTLCDAHGRKVVVVAGTIHQGNDIGIFEQSFGLVRDPAADFSWKIKFIRLAFSLSNPPNSLALPSLDYTRNMLTN